MCVIFWTLSVFVEAFLPKWLLIAQGWKIIYLLWVNLLLTNTDDCCQQTGNITGLIFLPTRESGRWRYKEFFCSEQWNEYLALELKAPRTIPTCLEHVTLSLVVVKTSTRIGDQITLIDAKVNCSDLSFHSALASVFWPYEHLLKPLQMLEGFSLLY